MGHAENVHSPPAYPELVCRARRAQPGRRKKLTGAGQWWCRPGKIKDHTEDDAKAWGIKRAARARPAQPETYGVWAEHWPALELFLAMDSQWRVVADPQRGTLIYQGIDYTALYGHPKYARLDHAEQDALLAQVQLLELGARVARSDGRSLQEQDAEQRSRQRDAISRQVERQIDMALMPSHS
ncbi:DUF1799 domain-containing protein [Halomonas sp. HMF6819]|uniref:DUF1799 domain-containing protein n=1 Tax=Halomonas sp. HMF6819 TaxID=3373085 RepID=UPI003792FF85